MKKKDKHEKLDLIYVHVNKNSQYTISCGIEFHEFVQSVSKPLNHLLLLKHQFEDGEFNMHTQFDYVPNDKIENLVNADVTSFSEFCWVDFKEVEGLNVLTGEEIAELLYLAHIRHHLKMPFYNRLGNRYAYLSYSDGLFNKTYYRNIEDFYEILGNVLSLKMEHLKIEKNLFGVKKKRSYPAVEQEVLTLLSEEFRDGAVISLKGILQTRSHIEIPIWVLGDFSSVDDLQDEYRKAAKSPCNKWLVYDKKGNVWVVLEK